LAGFVTVVPALGRRNVGIRSSPEGESHLAHLAMKHDPERRDQELWQMRYRPPTSIQTH